MIKLENVNKTFGDHPALADINTEFKEHQTTVIVGPSGSGKSTLLRSLNLLEHPESGQYHFDDETIDFSKPITSKTVLELRRKTGMVFQDYNLFPHLTVVKNVMEGPIQVLKQSSADAKKTALDLLDKVGLADKAESFPSQLSGGQQQRVAIARSLAMNPEYILLDEPTSALDPELEAGVLRVLLELAQEKDSMIIVTHNLEFARAVADKILFVENGKILFDGTPAEFFKQPTQRIADFLAAMTFTTISDKAES
ncbi:amino acid ABC transporter ATP-binding protein [Lactiplantibacillus fabifermentans]|uniref:Amino acid abc transporter, atp-binding protein n=2 Tax=Lactiplantibacillus fabifermentans TaxID=483011 RepID=A0A0R2NBG3_9LACO|nr:amino acid ABC transporter ATP-binding protein [Lactiplantibacillus fabifermentans]ETY73130.1 amino acid ABC transporter ATP-binding protein [Lactiplantibacillus fabifermentans T30PCM01]KRO23246.1 amino acid abc transporter, atp-binding protein [Lactiplantibacillus fabifermentans DSM 21115]